AQALGFTNAAGQAKQFNIAGAGVDNNGALVNNGSVNQQNVFQLISLTGDATWGGLARWDMRGNALIAPTLTLNGFTLTKTNANQISLVAASVTSGDIDIKQGVLSVETSSAINGAGTITVSAPGYLGHFRTAAGAITRNM